MYCNKTFLAVILARSGSKRLINKNKKLLKGKPLISWTIEAALDSKYLDQTCVSSDDEEILSISSNYDQVRSLKRPDNLATDFTKSSDATLDAVSKFNKKYDYLLLLQPTSPLRTSEDIDESIKLIIESNKSSLVSISNVKDCNDFSFVMDTKYFIQRKYFHDKKNEDIKFFNPNGAIYIVNREHFQSTEDFYNEDTIGYLMPSTKSVDIDTIEDFRLAEKYLITEI